jgi:FtsZ-binding cell division protein ZapB
MALHLFKTRIEKLQEEKVRLQAEGRELDLQIEIKNLKESNDIKRQQLGS